MGKIRAKRFGTMGDMPEVRHLVPEFSPETSPISPSESRLARPMALGAYAVIDILYESVVFTLSDSRPYSRVILPAIRPTIVTGSVNSSSNGA